MRCPEEDGKSLIGEADDSKVGMEAHDREIIIDIVTDQITESPKPDLTSVTSVVTDKVTPNSEQTSQTNIGSIKKQKPPWEVLSKSSRVRQNVHEPRWERLMVSGSKPILR